MSDQHPVYAQPPDYAPAPPTESYGGDPFGAPPPPSHGGQAKKKPTALIIGLVVGCLLLCCCITGGAGLFLFVPSESVTSVGGSAAGDGADDLTGRDEDPRLAEWDEWDPETPVMLAPMPAEKKALVIEGLAIAAPEFALEEGVWYQGEYDQAEDWYYADGFYVRATHPASPDISAAVELWIQSDTMMAEGIEFETQDGDILSSAGDRQLVYSAQWGEGFRLSGEYDVELWKRLGRDWPGGLVIDAEGDCTSGIVVSISKWRQYAVDADYPVVSARYRFENDEWTLEDWEYAYPEDSGSPST